MATLKQKLALDKLVVNGGNVTQAMIEADYSPNTANTPQKLTESKGFKELMKEYGLTEGLITKALVEDIKEKPKNRLGELKLGAEILGMKVTEGTGDKTLIINLTGQTAKRYGINTESNTSSI